MNRRAFLRLSCIGLAAWPATDTIAKSAWTAGVGRVDITPGRSLWMAGFARRRDARATTHGFVRADRHRPNPYADERVWAYAAEPLA